MPVGRSTRDRTKMAVTEAGSGRPATSFVRVLAEGQERDGALLEVSPRTGRTHQIRVHLAAMKTPVLGDDAYGSAQINRRFSTLARRPMLHAQRLAFAHPRDLS